MYLLFIVSIVKTMIQNVKKIQKQLNSIGKKEGEKRWSIQERKEKSVNISHLERSIMVKNHTMFCTLLEKLIQLASII